MSAKTVKLRSAVGITAMGWAMNPAIVINPAATPQDLVSWAVSELKNLHEWLDIVACSSSDVVIEPNEFAQMVGTRIEPLLQGFHAALESDMQGMKGGAA